MTEESCIELGRLVRPVGLRGEVKLLLTPDFWPEAIGSERLELEQDQRRRPVKIVGHRAAGNCLVIKLEGVSNRDAAEALRDAELLLVGELDVDEPSEPRPWQLIGLRVLLKGGEDLGEVIDLLPMPGQPLLQVKGPTKVFEIPFVEPILCGVDWEDETIEVDPPVGLLEL
jgi:16S rRNA processing protein RimM